MRTGEKLTMCAALKSLMSEGACNFQLSNLPWFRPMGGCQKYVPFLGTLNIRCRIILGIQKATIMLTTTPTHMAPSGLLGPRWAINRCSIGNNNKRVLKQKIKATLASRAPCPQHQLVQQMATATWSQLQNMRSAVSMQAACSSCWCNFPGGNAESGYTIII